MEERTAELIRELATQLGTTADRLWAVMVSGIVTRSIVHLSASVVVLSLLLLAAWRCIKWTREEDITADSEILIVGGIVGGIGGLMLTVFLIITMVDCVVGLLNPEYAALVRILEMVRPGK